VKHDISHHLFQRAQRVIPGGVNSPVRAFKSVLGEPVFISRGEGCRVFDEDGNSYIDYVCSWGPLILGHAHPRIVEAVKRAAENGTSFGASTAIEVELAEKIVDAVPSIEMVRLVSSGTEAVMSAIRVARGYTGRSKVVKFEGNYHGHSDSLLTKAGSGIATFGIPDSAGVPQAMTTDTITLPYNDEAALERAVASEGENIACVILEPVAGNMGVVPPRPGFLEAARRVCSGHGIVLIFDEVITGFRIAYGGAQSLYGVAPDMTVLGKIIGGGLPMGAYGGRREIMECVAPVGPVYQAGTLSGNPLAVTAGLETLKLLGEPGVYEELERKSAILASGLADVARSAGVAANVNRVGSMLTCFFSDAPVVDYASAKASNTNSYARFFHSMLESGHYFAPSQFEAAFVSAAHSDEDIAATLAAAAEALHDLPL